MTKGEIYRMERDKGLKYREIAEKYGVSKQMVAFFCGKYQPTRFTPYDEKRCRYVNLRNWLNKEKLTQAELIRRLGYEVLKPTRNRIWNILSGRLELRKSEIDKFIALTGLTYEQLFAEDEKGGAE
jgi:transcriptional regulator with XRE-family HTH domain